ncbi:MAG: molybdopterin-binding protein, partial [Thermoplasmata archaeon]
MKIFHQLLSINEAINEIEKRYGKLKPLGEETVSLKESLGRIISREIFASIDSPPFDRSEVDGYAVNHLDLIGADESNPIKLRILGKSSVGVMPQFYLIKNTCAEISTGAPIPKGATAVVMVEYTKSDGQYVTFFRSVAPGENIAQAGSDVMVGDTTLRSGTRISSREIAILASLGINEINVFKRLNVGIISTGDEIVSPGEILTSGKIFDTNQYSIGARLNEIGAIPKYYGIVKDDYSLIKEKILKAISENDIVITSGSTSAGMGDLIYSVIDDIGELIVHGLKIKPGKPTTVGISNGKLIFGLPGFPFSAIVAYEFFVKKILLKLSGFMGEEEKFIGKMAMRLNSSKNVEEFFPVSIISNKNGYSIYPLFGNSGSITTLLYADGIIRIPEDTNFIDENESIEVIPISSSIKVPKLTVIGS